MYEQIRSCYFDVIINDSAYVFIFKRDKLEAF